MTDSSSTDSRRHTFETIRAKEIARGASEDEATKIAADTVDKVLAQETARK